MKVVLIFVLFSALCFQAKGYDEPVKSPNGRYVIFLAHPQNAPFPVIMLRDTRTDREEQVFDCDSVGQGSDLEAIWSPDSRHVALTLAMGPATQDVAVYHVAAGMVREVELLPIPRSIDASSHGHRGGPRVKRWQDNRTIWISDGQKNRVFRYRLTKQGKLLADGFKQLDPK